MLAGSRCAAIVAALLVACDNGAGDAVPPSASEPVLTQPEQLAELMRQSRLISEELESIQGVGVRARVERGGQALLESSPGGVAVGRGFFSVDAKLEDGESVMVYVPDDVVVADGALIYVLAGQHGHYFRSFASDRDP